eukprot:s946_g6.t1
MSSCQAQRSVVGAIILALGIQQTLPVVCLIGLLGIGVHKHLNLTASQEASLTALKHQEVLLLHNQASQWSNDGRRDAPINKFAIGHFEGRSVKWAHNHVPNHISALAHGRANVRAQIAHAEKRTGLSLANQDIVAGKSQGFQLRVFQL